MGYERSSSIVFGSTLTIASTSTSAVSDSIHRQPGPAIAADLSRLELYVHCDFVRYEYCRVHLPSINALWVLLGTFTAYPFVAWAAFRAVKKRRLWKFSTDGVICVHAAVNINELKMQRNIAREPSLPRASSRGSSDLMKHRVSAEPMSRSPSTRRLDVDDLNSLRSTAGEPSAPSAPSEVSAKSPVHPISQLTGRVSQRSISANRSFSDGVTAPSPARSRIASSASLVSNVSTQQLAGLGGATSPARAPSVSSMSSLLNSSASTAGAGGGSVVDFRKGMNEARGRDEMVLVLQGALHDSEARYSKLHREVQTLRNVNDQLRKHAADVTTAGNETKMKLQHEIDDEKKRIDDLQKEADDYRRRERATSEAQSMTRSEEMKVKSEILGRLLSLRAVSETIQGLLDGARRKLKNTGKASALSPGGSTFSVPAADAQQAEKKIQAAQMTFESLISAQEGLSQEIMSMARIAPVAQQVSELAEHTNVLRSELKKGIAEITRLRHERDAARAQVSDLQATLSSDAETIQRRAADQLAELTHSAAVELSETREKAAAEVSALESRLNAERESFEKQIKSLSEALESAQAASASSSADAAAARATIQELQQELSQLKSSHAEESTKHSAETASATATIRTLEADIEQLQAQLAERSARVVGLEATEGALSLQLSDTKSALASSQSLAEESRCKHAELESKSAEALEIAAKRILSLEGEIASSTSALTAAEERLKLQQVDLTAATTVAGEQSCKAAAAIAALEGQKQELESKISLLEQQLAAANARCAVFDQTVSTLRSDVEAAKSAAAADRDAASASAHKAAAEASARITGLQMSVDTYKDMLESEKAKNSAIEGGIQRIHESYEQKLKELDSRLQTASLSQISGSSVLAAKEAALAESESRIAALTARAAAAEQQVAAVIAEVVGARDIAAAATAAAAAADARVAAMQQQHASAAKETSDTASSLRADSEELRTQLAENAAHIAELEAAIASHERKANADDASKADAEASSARVAELEQRLASSQSELVSLRQQVAQLQQELAEQAAENADLHRDFDVADSQHNALAESSKAAILRAGQLEYELENLKRTSAIEIGVLNEHLAAANEAAKAAAAASQEVLNGTEAEVVALNAACDALRKRAQAAEASAVQLSLELNRALAAAASTSTQAGGSSMSAPAPVAAPSVPSVAEADAIPLLTAQLHAAEKRLKDSLSAFEKSKSASAELDAAQAAARNESHNDKQRVAAANALVESAQAEAKQARSEVLRLESELKLSVASALKAQGDLQAANARMESALLAAQTSRSAAEEAESMLGDAYNQLASMTSEARELKVHAAGLKSSLNEAKAELGDVKAALENKTAERDALASRLAVLQSQLESSSRTGPGAASELETARADAAAAHQLYQATLAQLTTAQREAADARAAAVHDQATASSSTAALMSQVESLTGTLRDNEQRLQHATTKMAQLQSELDLARAATAAVAAGGVSGAAEPHSNQDALNQSITSDILDDIAASAADAIMAAPGISARNGSRHGSVASVSGSAASGLPAPGLAPTASSSASASSASGGTRPNLKSLRASMASLSAPSLSTPPLPPIVPRSGASASASTAALADAIPPSPSRVPAASSSTAAEAALLATEVKRLTLALDNSKSDAETAQKENYALKHDLQTLKSSSAYTGAVEALQRSEEKVMQLTEQLASQSARANDLEVEIAALRVTAKGKASSGKVEAQIKDLMNKNKEADEALKAEKARVAEAVARAVESEKSAKLLQQRLDVAKINLTKMAAELEEAEAAQKAAEQQVLQLQQQLPSSLAPSGESSPASSSAPEAAPSSSWGSALAAPSRSTSNGKVTPKKKK